MQIKVILLGCPSSIGEKFVHARGVKLTNIGLYIEFCPQLYVCFTTRWQELEVGIPMGCTISPILFAMAMEVIVRSARAQGRGVELAPNQVLPPIRAFMDDLTLLNPSTNEADKVLVKLEELVQWARMKFKPRKSRSLVLK